MPFLFAYLLKLSIALGVVWIFYRLLLERLTFYNWNRWYLLGYTLIAGLLAFVNISPVLQQRQWNTLTVMKWVPVIGEPVTASPVVSQHAPQLDAWSILLIVLLMGMLVTGMRLAIQLISFRRMKRKARLISGDGMKIYQVDEPIVPFSFGNSIFINAELHPAHELAEIIRHEFVHVRQRHSIDMLWAELLCLVNWYNPAAWLLKKSIRQNLEFIADRQVLSRGIARKDYQYLLLKVIGNNQYSIANQFNFSSLKKRIAMMNKLKTPRKQLLRMLFLLPATAVLLLAFRDKWQVPQQEKREDVRWEQPTANDTLPNSKGYWVSVQGGRTSTVIVKDKNGKEVERIPMDKWRANASRYEELYGELPPPPKVMPPPPPPSPPTPPAPPVASADAAYSSTDFFKRNPSVKNVSWVFSDPSKDKGLQMVITHKDGKEEKYYTGDPAAMEAAEKKYGPLPVTPPPPPAPPVPMEAPTEGMPPTPPPPPAAPIEVVADSIHWSPQTHVLYFKGNALVNDKWNRMDVRADLISMKQPISHVFIDGKEVMYEKAFSGKGLRFRIEQLNPERAIEKYGEQGKDGVVEITTL